jgi:hypothetical protein
VWIFQPTRRLGHELFGAEHAKALGDLQTADGLISGVRGKTWSLGAAIVIH